MVNALRLLIVIGTLTGVVLVGNQIWRHYEIWRGRRVAESLADQAQGAATNGIARGAVRRISELPNDGLATLVQLAASPHSQAALAAQEAIDAKLIAVAQVRGADSVHADAGAQLAELSAALAKYSGQFQGRAAGWAQRTAVKIMIAADVADSGQLVMILANCERAVNTLSTSSISLEAEATRGTNNQVHQDPGGSLLDGKRPAETLSHPLPSPNSPRFVAPSVVDDRAASVPDGSEYLTLPTSNELSATRRSPSRDLAWIPRYAAAAPSQMAERPIDEARSTITVARADARPAPLPRRAASQAANHPQAEQRSGTAGGLIVMDVPSPESVRRINRMVLDLPRERLVHELQAAANDPTRRFLAAAIIRELQRRGISVSNAGRRDVSGDRVAADEDALSHDLKPGATRQELYAMTRHADPTVRTRALSLLATSDDPRLPALARERAIHDADPQVAEVASRILQDVVRR